MDDLVICKNCEWVGEEDDCRTERDGDSYDPNTQFWRTCPRCGSTEIEEFKP